MISRSDVVGSLLRPDYLREARKAAREGRISGDELRAVEDRAVREAITLQESAGLDVITDGELRRSSWVVTIPLREEAAPSAPIAGFEFLPADAGWWSLWKEPDGRRAQVWTLPTRPFITKPLTVVRDLVTTEYAFLEANARARTKFTIPAPSWHRIASSGIRSTRARRTRRRRTSCARSRRTSASTSWRRSSRSAATTCRWTRRTTRSGTSIPATAPRSSRGATTWRPSWSRARRSTTSSSRACAASRARCTSAAATPRAAGGRARPLHDKTGRASDAVEARIKEAGKTIPLERLAVSPQCGFASGEAGNR